MTTHAKMVCLGTITKAHGIKGHVYINSYCENPEDIFAYAPLTDIEGKHTYTIRKIGVARELFIAEVEGITSRNDAENLAKTNLYVRKDQLPNLEETDDGVFYVSDLLGLNVLTPNHEEIGKIVGVDNFGAGDVLECKSPEHATFMLPFSEDAVVSVNMNEVYIVISEMAMQFVQAQGDHKE
jgi:16S rRNA processing protein RimM